MSNFKLQLLALCEGLQSGECSVNDFNQRVIFLIEDLLSDLNCEEGKAFRSLYVLGTNPYAYWQYKRSKWGRFFFFYLFYDGGLFDPNFGAFITLTKIQKRALYLANLLKLSINI